MPGLFYLVQTLAHYLKGYPIGENGATDVVDPQEDEEWIASVDEAHPRRPAQLLVLVVVLSSQPDVEVVVVVLVLLLAIGGALHLGQEEPLGQIAKPFISPR